MSERDDGDENVIEVEFPVVEREGESSDEGRPRLLGPDEEVVSGDGAEIVAFRSPDWQREGRERPTGAVARTSSDFLGRVDRTASAVYRHAHYGRFKWAMSSDRRTDNTGFVLPVSEGRWNVGISRLRKEYVEGSLGLVRDQVIELGAPDFMTVTLSSGAGSQFASLELPSGFVKAARERVEGLLGLMSDKLEGDEVARRDVEKMLMPCGVLKRVLNDGLSRGDELRFHRASIQNFAPYIARIGDGRFEPRLGHCCEERRTWLPEVAKFGKFSFSNPFVEVVFSFIGGDEVYVEVRSASLRGTNFWGEDATLLACDSFDPSELDSVYDALRFTTDTMEEIVRKYARASWVKRLWWKYQRWEEDKRMIARHAVERKKIEDRRMRNK